MTQTQALTWAPIKEAGRQRQRPAGRSGHTITAMGPNVYIFGGLVEDASPAGPTDQLWLLTMSSTDAEWQVCPKKVRTTCRLSTVSTFVVHCTRSLLRDTAKTFFHSLQILRFGSNMYTYVLVILRIMYGKLSITCVDMQEPLLHFPVFRGVRTRRSLPGPALDGDTRRPTLERTGMFVLRGVICVMYGQHDCRMHLRLAPRIDRNSANSIVHNVLIQATCEAAPFDWLISMLNIIPLTLLVHF